MFPQDAYLVVVTVLLIMSVFIFFKLLYKGSLSLLGFLMILVGALYNLYFRYFGSCVYDPINLGLFHSNYADILIVSGLLFICAKNIISK